MEASTIQLQAMNMHHSLNEIMVCTKPPQQQLQQQQQQQQQEKKVNPHPESSLRCPRCDSTNTKFCYYNNYSLSQPRYFCKGCRRYWTQGGSLRNVPVGGGCRKNKRSSSSKTRQLDHHHIHLQSSNPLLISPLTPSSLPYNLNDLSFYEHGTIHTGNPNSNVLGASPALLDILRGAFSDTIQGGLYHIYNGGVEEKSTAAQVGGGVGATAAAAAAEEEYCKSMDGEGKMVVGMQWQMAGAHGNMGVDPGRDYSWGSASVAPSWHGLDNSSLL